MDTKTKRTLRRRLYIDREVQRGMMLRAVLYWFFSLSAILLFVAIVSAWMNPSELAFTYFYRTFVDFAPGILASVLLLPLFVYDMLRASHRVAGPIYRMRNEMRKLVEGQDVRALRFRDGDYWPGLAEDFNELAEVVMQLRQQKEPDASKPGSSLMRV